jgi:RNA polymerase sigma-70 factor (ECF subfamily)
VASRTWPERGVPPNPGGWITTTARRRAIDRLRRESRRDELQDEAARMDGHVDRGGEAFMHDDRLREAHTATSGDALGRTDLSDEAIRLGRLLAALMPDESEVLGFLALMLLPASRQPARTGADGSLTLLADQDRTLWDADLIAEGQALVRTCLRRGRPGVYQLQAAINAVHSDAATAADTDWGQIVALYDQLLTIAPTPVVALNRAVALAEVEGPQVALEAIDGLDFDAYHPYHATRADLLRRLGRSDEAAAAYATAAGLTTNATERDFLDRRRSSITTSAPSACGPPDG